MRDNLIGRVGRIVSGGVNAIVDGLENAAPHAVMAEAIREVDGAVDEVRRELSRTAAQRHVATKRLSELNAEHEGLGEKIAMAVSGGRDDLAKSAIARQIDLEAQVPVLERAVADASDEERELRASVEALLAKRREMEARLAELREAARASASAGSSSGTSDLGGTRGPTAADRAERAGAAFERGYGSATGMNGLGRTVGSDDAARLAELEALTREHRIEERLASIKGGTS